MCNERHTPSHRRDNGQASGTPRRGLLSPLMLAVRVTDVRRATRITSTVVLVIGLVLVGLAGNKTKANTAIDEIGTLLFLGGFGGVVIPWIGHLIASFQIRRHARALLRRQKSAIDPAELAQYVGQLQDATYRLNQYDQAWAKLANLDQPSEPPAHQKPWPGFEIIDGEGGDKRTGLRLTRPAFGTRPRGQRGRS
jgi:hypothetical protein